MKKDSRFLNMSFKELDEEIDKLPYNWMKAIMFVQIKKVRSDYVQKYIREKEEKKND